MEENRWMSRRVRFMKVRDPLYVAVMLALLGIGVILALAEGESSHDIVVFLIFAIAMMYLGVR